MEATIIPGLDQALTAPAEKRSTYLDSDRAKEFRAKTPGMQYDDEWIICPHCGIESGDCWEWVKEHAEEETCGECGGRYRYWAEYSVTYYTSPIKEDDSGTPKDTG